MSFVDLEARRGGSLASSKNINGCRQDTMQAVASGIFQINTSVSTYQRLVNTLGTPKDTPVVREKLHKTRLHIEDLVKDTSAKLKEASETDHQSGVNPKKKIVDAKLAKDFQAVLKEFQKAQRLAAERETLYAPLVHKPYLPSSYTASETDVNAGKHPEQSSLLVKRQELLLFENEIAYNEGIIEEREQVIEEIEQQIGEVQEIFQHLAVLVNDQGTKIDDINTHIENSLAATGQGMFHLEQASQIQSSNTSLIVGVFGIVLMVVIIVILL